MGNEIEFLQSVLNYIETEREKVYESRMDDSVNYDDALRKTKAFFIIENHINENIKRLKN